MNNEEDQDLTTYPSHLTRTRMRVWGSVSGMSENIKKIEQKALEGRSKWEAPERLAQFQLLPPLRSSKEHVNRANA